MELISLSCNKCGAPLEVPINANFVTCSYCKSRLAIHSTENAYYTEVLGEIDRKTSKILSKVDTLLDLQKESGKWETCEIKWEGSVRRGVWRQPDYWFVAYAVDPDGSYEASRVGPFYAEIETIGDYNVPIDAGEAAAAFKHMLSQLSQDGWEPTPQTGTDWYERRFRRRIGWENGPQWEWCHIDWGFGPEHDEPEGTLVFTAEADGNDSPYTISRSAPAKKQLEKIEDELVIPKDTGTMRRVFDDFLDSLMEDGWLLNEEGEHWYSWSLRRRVSQ
jgi:DNA-directed RNA polymerase subunit RPC12/RpoP